MVFITSENNPKYMVTQIPFPNTYKLRVERRKSTKGEKIYYSVHLPKMIEKFGWKAGDRIGIVAYFADPKSQETPLIVLKNVDLDYRLLKRKALQSTKAQ